MKKMIAFTLAIALLFILIATTAYAAGSSEATDVYDDGKDGLKQWAVAFKEHSHLETDRLKMLVKDINTYSKNNKCSVEDVIITQNDTEWDDLYSIVIFKN